MYSSLGTLLAVFREVGRSASGAILYTIDTVRLEAFARLEKELRNVNELKAVKPVERESSFLFFGSSLQAIV